MEIWKELWVCPDQNIDITAVFEPISETWYAECNEFDGEFEVFFKDDGNLSHFNFFAPNATPGQTYTATIIVWEDAPNVGESTTLLLKVHVRESCEELYDNCCDGMNIQWLNQVGGMQNYYFNGVKTFEVTQENAKRYIDYNKIARYSDRGNVYKGMIVSTKAIPQEHVDLLDSLRYSIQAYENRDDVLYPILIDPESYTKYKSKDKKFDVFIKFIYAEPVKIQTQ